MYAVITSGGQQYRVKENQVIKLEKIELEPGADIEFDNILMLADGDKIQIGAPYVKGCKVVATVCKQARAPKINILKFKRRKHHMKRMGHRQWYTEVKITAIKVA